MKSLNIWGIQIAFIYRATTFYSFFLKNKNIMGEHFNPLFEMN